MRSIFIILLCFLISCNKKTVAPTISIPPVLTPAKTYLALGDSYTIGQSVAESERFPAQIVSLLKQQGININSPVYIAQTGWTTANLQSAIANQNPPSTFDVVSLLIGVNDQYQGMDTSIYALRFTQLLEKAVQLADGKKSNVFVLSIPDYSATPFVPSSNKQKVSMEIDWFNAINKRITTSFNVSYSDITPSTREAATNTALIANDNLHPSGLEYKKWAELVAPKMRTVLR